MQFTSAILALAALMMTTNVVAIPDPNLDPAAANDVVDTVADDVSVVDLVKNITLDPVSPGNDTLFDAPDDFAPAKPIFGSVFTHNRTLAISGIRPRKGTVVSLDDYVDGLQKGNEEPRQYTTISSENGGGTSITLTYNIPRGLDVYGMSGDETIKKITVNMVAAGKSKREQRFSVSIRNDKNNEWLRLMDNGRTVAGEFFFKTKTLMGKDLSQYTRKGSRLHLRVFTNKHVGALMLDQLSVSTEVEVKPTAYVTKKTNKDAKGIKDGKKKGKGKDKKGKDNKGKDKK